MFGADRPELCQGSREQIASLIEAPRPRGDTSQIAGRHADHPAVVGGAELPQGLPEELLGFIEPALIREHQRNIRADHRRPDRIARLRPRVSASAVELERFTPLPGVVGVDSQLVEDLRLPDEFSEFLIDLEGTFAVSSLGPVPGPLPRETEQVVAVGESLPVSNTLRFRDSEATPVNGVTVSRLAETNTRIREL